ncbi:MAG: hypothetical protein Q4D60_05065 [Eubacteriales bacterium]|nr:hypothetical protein [Eubacteriales bacterium]
MGIMNEEDEIGGLRWREESVGAFQIDIDGQKFEVSAEIKETIQSLLENESAMSYLCYMGYDTSHGRGTPNPKSKDELFVKAFKNTELALGIFKRVCDILNIPYDPNLREDDVRDEAISTSIFKSFYNDVSFSVGDRHIILLEEQSTWSPNIVFRILVYYVQTMTYYVFRKNQNMYGTGILDLQEPIFCVVFPLETEQTLKNRRHVRYEEGTYWLDFSQIHFSGSNHFLNARVLILTEESHMVIGEYSLFARELTTLYKEYRRCVKETNNKNLALDVFEEKVSMLLKEERFREFVKYLGSEGDVIKMLKIKTRDEYIMEARMEESREQGRKEGRKEGREAGREEERLKRVKVFFSKVTDNTLSLNDLASMFELPINEVKSLYLEWKKTV